MKESVKKILDYVCEMCDLSQDEILTNNRTMPLPLVRGFFWYIVRRATGYSNLYIAKITSNGKYTFTSAGVGSAITRIIDAISHDRLWESRWKKVVEDLGLSKVVEKDQEVLVTMVVPKGMRNKVKFDIREKVR